MFRLKVLGVAFFSLAISFSGFSAKAASYDIYVDASNSGGDGSKDDPYEDLDKALEKASSGDGIFVKSGSYNGGLSVKKSVKIYGTGSGKTIINGTVTMSDGSLLKGVTIKKGGPGVVISANAKVTIDDCEIRDSGRIGIDVKPGNGKLTLKNSKVHHGSGKAVYVQAGNAVDIVGNKVYDNSEEGLDIRNNVDGTISSNELYGNGESGVEIILGSSDILISKNSIKSNGASGIAAQYYKSFGKIGNARIRDNRINSNRHFGLNCKSMSGLSSGSYWQKSLTIEENEVSGNKTGDISAYCKLEDGSDAEVGKQEVDSEKEAIQVDTQEESVNIGADEEIRVQDEAALRALEETKAAEFDDKFKSLINSGADVRSRLDNHKALGEKKNKFLVFLFGQEEDLRLKFQTDVEEERRLLNDLEVLDSTTEDADRKRAVEERMGQLEQEIAADEDLLGSMFEKRGIMNWDIFRFIR